MKIHSKTSQAARVCFSTFFHTLAEIQRGTYSIAQNSHALNQKLRCLRLIRPTKMSVVSNFSCRHCKIRPVLRSDTRAGLASSLINQKLSPFRKVNLIQLRTVSRRSCIQMALVDERIGDRRDMVIPADILAYDLVQGADVRWSYILDKSVPEPPTAVLLHGILGSRKNWGTFARRLAKEFPKWQFLLVDLRCHGDSACIIKKPPHTVASAALDVLMLLGQLKLTPRVVVGHSFGGKVALSMVDQVPKPLARPVRVWVLDATPGKVRAGADGDDHPAELISFLTKFPKEVSSKKDVMEALVQDGFSKDVAQWVVTNLRQTRVNGSPSPSFSWMFDLKGISDMYQSYEDTNMWKIVEDVPRGVHINFLKAERSLHRWGLEDVRRIHVAEEQAVEEGGGVEMHVLEDAGHWVHADNPDGLFRILSFSFQGF